MPDNEAQGGEPNDATELQFDRVGTEAPGSAIAANPSVACTLCRKSVGSQYYQVNGKPFCDNCRQIVTTVAATPRSPALLVRASVFGLGGAIAGALVYYGVARLTGSEIGIVAIVTGYLVGYCVRNGAGGRGGRRFQILALVLTYWSVGLAYALLSLNVMSVSDAVNFVTHVSLLLVALTLPVISVVRSMPWGLLSALIIGIGLRQAWTMTAAPTFAISGPYKVGAGSEPVTT